MDNSKLLDKLGFGEMYEWNSKTVLDKPEQYGYFVQFSSNEPGKIEPYNFKGFKPVGVTTVYSAVDSDNPDDWKYKYYKNAYGDTYVKYEDYAVGVKKYDQVSEFSFMGTEKRQRPVPIPIDEYDSSLNYVKREFRPEWVRVNLLGKVIVRDDGTSVEGHYCTPYVGDDKTKYGTATAAVYDEPYKYYVIERLTDSTILILNQ